ncbi:MAG: extensin family protein [Bdellovibrionales bacterium]|nr:extensin family protein [Bdellovibrionales bacterium]
MHKRKSKLKKIAFIITIALTVYCFSNKTRTFLENIYIGAPPIILFNQLRPYLGELNSSACYQALNTIKLPFRKMADNPEDMQEDCFFKGMILIKHPLKEKRHISCKLAYAIFQYYEYVLQPLAVKLFGAKLVSITDKGVRSCRNMTGHKFLLSEHAYSNAIDIVGFEFENGENILISRDWGSSNEKGEFLKSAYAKACKLFNMVISPKYDESHSDHLHLDMGLSKGCY